MYTTLKSKLASFRQNLNYKRTVFMKTTLSKYKPVHNNYDANYQCDSQNNASSCNTGENGWKKKAC